MLLGWPSKFQAFSGEKLEVLFAFLLSVLVDRLLGFKAFWIVHMPVLITQTVFVKPDGLGLAVLKPFLPGAVELAL